MNLGKLGNKLRREIAANPKKAAFLGLATLVAVYFWMPLVLGWIGKRDQAMATATAKTDAMPITAAMGAAPTGETAAKETVPNRPSWPQVVQWMHNDPRTMTAPLLTKMRDPFEPSTIEAADTKAQEQSKLKSPAITPTAAGLVLTSTIIGPQRRVAQIDGKTYTVGQTIEVAQEKAALGVEFKLIEVHSRRAVLEADGQRFELMIPEPGKSNKIEFLGVADGK